MYHKSKQKKRYVRPRTHERTKIANGHIRSCATHHAIIYNRNLHVYELSEVFVSVRRIDSHGKPVFHSCSKDYRALSSDLYARTNKIHSNDLAMCDAQNMLLCVSAFSFY